MYVLTNTFQLSRTDTTVVLDCHSENMGYIIQIHEALKDLNIQAEIKTEQGISKSGIFESQYDINRKSELFF